jgi:pyruvate dehydrogenase (quinone)
MTVGEFILRRLRAWGVQRIYGYPGDGINGILGGFHEVGDEVEFVQVRHEELASFAACAHAKLTGEVGVCLATSGPGAVHLLNGVYDAKLDHQPLVAIVGQQARSSLGGDYQQEVDLVSLYKDVAHEFVQVMTVPEQAAQLVDRAMRIAAATRSPTAIIVPNDVQEADHTDPPRSHGSIFTSPGWEPPRVVPPDAALDRAAEVLNAGEKVAMLIGAGAIGAEAEVEQAADLLGCGVAKALNGKAALSDELPFVTGSIGLLGTKPSADMMDGCDTLLMVGTSFPYSEWLPKPGQARAVQIDHDGWPCATRSTPSSSATPARPCARCCRACSASPTAPGARTSRRASTAGGGSSTSAPTRTPTRSTRSASSTSSPSACPTGRSSPRTRARRRTGGPGTSACGPGCRPRCRARSPRCARPCPTRWPRSSPTPTAR